jgi:hypothetical protein
MLFLLRVERLPLAMELALRFEPGDDRLQREWRGVLLRTEVAKRTVMIA